MLRAAMSRAAAAAPSIPVPTADTDIGACWRRLARWGAAALIVATLIPSSDGQIMWLYMDTLSMYALAMTPPRIRPALHADLLFLFSAMSWTIVLTGWLVLWVTRNRGAPLLAPSRGALRGARALFLLSWLAPCFFAALYTWRFKGFAIPVLVAGVALQLVLGATIQARARRRAGTPDAVLWLMSLPIAATLFGWACIGSIFLLSPGPIFAHGIVLGAGGTLTLWVAWIQWWRALTAHQRGAPDALSTHPTRAA